MRRYFTLAAPEDRPTEPLRKVTRPLEALPWAQGALPGELTCARCLRLTGNSNQGHYWKWCKVTRRYEEFHFCCPGSCELHQA